jgi:hypothetical protein
MVRERFGVGRSHVFGSWFWLALTALLLNDHVLKGSGWVPGWLTGKLSDFAGLVVLALLIAGIFHVRSPAARLTVVALVGGVFAAVKTSRALANDVEAILAVLGVPSRIWCDSTDLMALLILPFVFRWMAPRDGSESEAHPGVSTLDRMAAVLGSVACLATSAEPVSYDLAQLLINATREPISVYTYTLVDELDCEAVAADPQAALAGAVFELDLCRGLNPWEPMSLGSSETCGATLLSAPGLSPIVLVWKGTEIEPMALGSENDSYLHDVGDRLYLDPGPSVMAWDFTGDLPETRCELVP